MRTEDKKRLSKTNEHNSTLFQTSLLELRSPLLSVAHLLASVKITLLATEKFTVRELHSKQERLNESKKNVQETEHTTKQALK